MKKLHGTYSIQPLTITDAVIAEDARISESKINLSFSTANIQQDVDEINLSLDTHLNNDVDPHGETLHQTTLQTENIQSGTDISTRTINVSNPGEGDVLLNVEGDISAVNASFSGDTSIAGITTIGGQTHITGNVVIDGNLSVSGETTTVESNTIDYDSLIVTPSTALNRTGIIVAPDGTGFSSVSTVTTETVTVHDDILYAPDDLEFVGVLPNNDLVFLVSNNTQWGLPRLVITNSLGTEIKISRDFGNLYDSDPCYQIQGAVVGRDGYIYAFAQIYNYSVFSRAALVKFDTSLDIVDTGTAYYSSGSQISQNEFQAMSFFEDLIFVLIKDGSDHLKVISYDPVQVSLAADSENVTDFTSDIQFSILQHFSVVNVNADGSPDIMIAGNDLPITHVKSNSASGEANTVTPFRGVTGGIFAVTFPYGAAFRVLDSYGTSLTLSDSTGSVIAWLDNEEAGFIADLDPEEYQRDSNDRLIGYIPSSNAALFRCKTTDTLYWLDVDKFVDNNDYEDDALIEGITEGVVLNSRSTMPEEGSSDVIQTVENTIETESYSTDTFTGNLLELQKRVNGFNEAAVIVDKNGTLKLLTGGLDVNGVKGETVNNVLTFNKALASTSITTSDAGFVYKPSSDNQPNNKVLDIQNASGISNAFITKNGDATVNSLTIGVSNPITEVGTGLNVPNDVCIDASELLLSDSVLTFAAENKDEWRVLNRNSSVSFYFDTDVVPQMELSDGLLDLSNCDLTKTDDLEVTGTALFRGSVSMAANTTIDGIQVGSHDHTGGTMGTVLPQTAVTGLKTFIDNINTTIQSCVNTMTTGNTENGISVAFDSTSKKLDFTVNDFTLTLTGDAAGSATIAHASNTSLAVTVKDSAKLGGLSLPSTTANTEANKVVRTDSSANTTLKTLSITAPVNANTATIAKIYASTGSETAVKYYTPANFATQILALGGTTKNSHTHTAVNGLTPVRGSSTFNGVSGRVIMLASSRSNTNYSVAVTPSAQPNGHLGEVWVIKGTDRFTVYNSGSATTAFDYIMLG